MEYIIFNGKKYSINDVLELNNDFSKENIKRQYHLLLRKYHPDNYNQKDPNYDKMIEKTQLINLAYKEAKKNIQSENPNSTKKTPDPKPKKDTKSNVHKETESLRKTILRNLDTLLVLYREKASKFKSIIDEMESIYNKNIDKLDNDTKHLFKDIIMNEYKTRYTNINDYYNYLYDKIYNDSKYLSVTGLEELHKISRNYLSDNTSSLIRFFYGDVFAFIKYFDDFNYLNYESADDIYALVCASTHYDRLFNSVCAKNNLDLDAQTKKLATMYIKDKSLFGIYELGNFSFLNQRKLKKKIEKAINNTLEVYHPNRTRR